MQLLRHIFIILTIFTVLSCSSSKTGEVIYTNKDYSIEERVEDLLSRMTLEEKVGQMRMFHANRGIKFNKKDGKMKLSDEVVERLKYGIGGIKNPGEHNSPEEAAKLNNQLQKYIIENNRLKIPTFFVTESYNGVDAEGCTRFGRPITLASSFNLDLVERVYDVMGREARLRGLHLTHSPEADIARDPRFGRMSETFGEDTYLTTEMIVSAINGLQGNYEGLKATHIGAVAKHFAGYAQVAGGRNFASVEISPRTLIDEIFPPFKAAVQRSKTLGVMASHGDINGVASHSNPWLLTEVLRNQWGFDGYVVSDANDVARLNFFMNVAETPIDAAILGLKASVDLDLYSDEAYILLPKIIEKHPELISYVDNSVKRILRTKFRLGLFENPYTDVDKAAKEIRNEAAVKLAHEADLESLILLKNENNILPINTEKYKKIALVGPVMNETAMEDFQKVFGQDVKLFAEKGFSLTDKAKAKPNITSKEKMLKGIDKIITAAKKSQLIILFVGGDEYTAKEAYFNNVFGDRDNIAPVGYQDKLIAELKKLGKPVVVAFKHRRTLSINYISEAADAILDCWDISELGNSAIARTLIGESVPSGKMPVTVPRNVGQLPIHYSQKEINYKKGYLFSDVTPLYPFGYGISYTTFEYSNMKLSSSTMKLSGPTITASIDIKNTGSFEAKEVVQLYVKDSIGQVLRPIMELKGFQKINLKPGEQKTVEFEIKHDMFEFTGLDMKKVIETGTNFVMIGGSSDALTRKEFKMVE